MALAADNAGRHAVGRQGGRLMLLIVAMTAVALGGGIGVGLHFLLKRGPVPQPDTISMRHGLYGDATWASGALKAPPINKLRDQDGARFALGSLRGHPVAIVFFDSHCHQECPLEGRQLAAAELRLPAAERPDLVVVSVNPLDTRASVAHAIRAWGLAGASRWYWLMGTRRQLAPVWAEYKIQVSPPVDGDIAHTEALYLIDRHGYERAGYLWPFASRFATYDMRVLAGHGAA
jgi:cytochrome oxidase Cu insertion factor (SCO1/SenC/PrrC family)